ncbi:endochitinase A-like [Sipha flava]|uniref:Endochitinase A-like n=1 Tax=Sipha flava TaxID=143950 RepID=A0A2S2R224_9HEMI|nr:endochitinase A-like [Sipha flava]
MIASRIFCVLTAVLWDSGIWAAPTVTYDQRQHGEYNLRVDLDDVAVLLLPGSELFAQRTALTPGLFKIFGRRNGGGVGGHSKKKQKNCSTTTTTTTTTSTTTERPEVPYGEIAPSPGSSSQGYEEVAQGPEEIAQGDVLPSVSTGPEKTAVFAEPDLNDRLVESANRKTVSTSDLLYVTPTNVPAGDHAVEAGDVVAVADDKFAVSEAVTGLTEMVIVNTVEKHAGSSTAIPDDLDEVQADVKPIKNEPSAVLWSPDVKTASDETKKTEETATVAAKAEEIVISSEKSNAVEKPEKHAVPTSTATGTENKSALKSTDVEKSISSADEKSGGVTGADVEPVEMVAMKAVAKPTSAGTSKVVPKLAAADTATKSSATGNVGVPSSDGVVVTEMIAMKTMEKPSSAVTAVDGSETGAVPTEMQPLRKKPAGEPDETIVSRSAPKLTEMVAVKTMENPATVSTMKSVIAVKTVIKPGTPNTTVLSNGSSVMRKVGDRKPLPSVSLDVAPPIAV